MYRVNICTHLKKRDKKTGAVVNAPQNIRQIKYGNTYPELSIPQIFPYGRVLREVYEVPKGKLYGWNCVRFKNGHSREQNDKFYSPSVPKLKKK